VSLRGQAERVEPFPAQAQFLVVTCWKTQVALWADLVRGIEPFEGSGADGTVTYAGQAYPVIAMATRFGFAPLVPTSDSRIVLCGMSASRRGVIVDHVWGLTEVATQQIRPLPPHFAGPERGWFTGLFVFGETAALVVDSAWLLGRVADTARPTPGAVAPSPRTVPALEAEPAEPVDVVPLPGEALPIMDLEEATDAEDTPWAEL
jgi:hypothetical protein